MSESPLDEVGGRLPHQPFVEGVRLPSAVPIGVANVGGNDVWRIASDQVEAVTCNRLEQAALAKLDVSDSVEPSIEGGQVKRSAIDVDGDHALRVTSEPESLHPRACPDVQGRRDRTTHRQAAEYGGWCRYRRDVICRRTARCLVWVSISREKQIRVGNEPERGLDRRPAVHGSAEPTKVVRSDRRKSMVDLVTGYGYAEEEEPDRDVEPRTGAQASEVYRHVALARLVGVVAEQTSNGITRVADRWKNGAKPVDRLSPIKIDRAVGGRRRSFRQQSHGWTLGSCRRTVDRLGSNRPPSVLRPVTRPVQFRG